MQIYANLFKINDTELWDFSPLINYGNLCKFIPKLTKIASSPFRSVVYQTELYQIKQTKSKSVEKWRSIFGDFEYICIN